VPSAFALAEGDDPPIFDLVSEEVWDHLVHLTDDVAIRTTNWIGSRVELLHEVSMQWLHATPVELEGSPYAPEPAFDAAEEFEACYYHFRDAGSTPRGHIVVRCLGAPA